MPEHSPLRLLIVDEHAHLRELCGAIAARLQLNCTAAEDLKAALQQMSADPAELVLADVDPETPASLEWLAEMKRRWPATEVVLMSASAGTECAVQAMRLGAYDFVAKPFRVEEFQLVLERMAEKARLVRENRSLRFRLQGQTPWKQLQAPPCTDLEELERLTVQRVFEQVGGDKEEAQRLLGISRATLYRMIQRYGIEVATRRRKSARRDGGTELDECLKSEI